MFGNLGFFEILVILGIFLVLFGHRRIPEVAKALAQGLKIFKNELATQTPTTTESSAVRPQTEAKTQIPVAPTETRP